MNLIYAVMISASLIMLLFTSPDSALTIMLQGATSSVKLAVTLCTIYAVWLSVLSIMERAGINKYIDKLFSPLTNKLFKSESAEAKNYINMNMTANFLGMGGAATPLGIKAMAAMQDGSEIATDNMILFMVINCTSIQLLPATIISLRASAGSTTSSDIILPSIIATVISTVVGVLICLILRKRRAK